MSIVYLNGAWVDAADAKISVFDRGFLFADGVYEVIPFYAGKPFRLNAHLDRLERSLTGLRIAVSQTRADWQALFAELVARNSAEHSSNGGNVSIYLQITRGAPPKRDHAFPKNAVAPTLFAMVSPMAKPPVDDLDAAVGNHAITAGDIRWTRADIKSVSLLPNILLRQMAVEQNAQECLLLRDGFVMEGSASNVFIVKDGIIKTPPLSHYILGGITRDVVIELARNNNLPVIECDISEQALRSADEVWVTSSTREIVPVTVLDGRPVGNGQTGVVWKRMAHIYRACKQAFVEGSGE